jgi:hypothetical protein
VAKGIKHSKIKNTGVLFEMLVRQITSDTLNGVAVSPALKIVKEHFGKNSALKKELNLYNSLIKEKFANIKRAERFVDLVLVERLKISEGELKRKKYNLIKEIGKKYDLNSFFRTKISNYKINASIYKLFESHKNKGINNPKVILECRDNIIDHISSAPRSTQEKVLKEYTKQDKEIRLLSYKILLEKFNKQYGKTLSEEQKSLLRKYITSNGKNTLNYIREEASKGRKNILKSVNKIDDKITTIKLKEVANQLKKVEKSKSVSDNHISTIMNLYELLKEIKVVTK